jgi:hypothetical protein
MTALDRERGRRLRASRVSRSNHAPITTASTTWWSTSRCRGVRAIAAGTANTGLERPQAAEDIALGGLVDLLDGRFAGLLTITASLAGLAAFRAPTHISRLATGMSHAPRASTRRGP